MKIVALEEHLVLPSIQQAWSALPPDRRDMSVRSSLEGEIAERLLDTDGERLRAMDDAGIDVQVLSLTAPGNGDRLRAAGR